MSAVASEKEPVNPSYSGDRPDLRAHVPLSARSVLDVGCSVGAVGAALKRAADREVVGIELDPGAARRAEALLDRVVVGDLDLPGTWQPLAGRHFDTVLLGDVLEHCRDPWAVFDRAVALLRPGGTAVVSLPNVSHYTSILALLRQRWPYEPRGIHDATHLRWFAERNVRELMAGASLQLRALHRNYRIIETPHLLNRWARFLAVPGLRGLLTYQFIAIGVLAERPVRAGGRAEHEQETTLP